MAEAVLWGKDNLNGTPYSIKYVDENGDVSNELP
jgi:hypothetical protein